MTTLAQLAPPTGATVETERGTLRVYPLTLGAIGQLLARHPALIAAFQGGGNAQLIVAAVLHSGPSAVFDVVDAATRSEPGSAAAAELNAFDEAEILIACIDATLPKNPARMGKFLADLGALMDRLGLNDVPEKPAA